MDGSGGIASGLGETLSDGSAAQPKKARMREGEGWDDNDPPSQGRRAQLLPWIDTTISTASDRGIDSMYCQSRRPPKKRMTAGWIQSSGRLLVRGPNTAEHRQGVYRAKAAGSFNRASVRLPDGQACLRARRTGCGKGKVSNGDAMLHEELSRRFVRQLHRAARSRQSGGLKDQGHGV